MAICCRSPGAAATDLAYVPFQLDRGPRQHLELEWALAEVEEAVAEEGLVFCYRSFTPYHLSCTTLLVLNAPAHSGAETLG